MAPKLNSLLYHLNYHQLNLKIIGLYNQPHYGKCKPINQIVPQSSIYLFIPLLHHNNGKCDDFLPLFIDLTQSSLNYRIKKCKL
jgi:hypothetical protein